MNPHQHEPVKRAGIVKALGAAIRRCEEVKKTRSDAPLGFEPRHTLAAAARKSVDEQLRVLKDLYDRAGAATREIDFDLRTFCICEFHVVHLNDIHVFTMTDFLQQCRQELLKNLLGSEREPGAQRQFHLHALALQARLLVVPPVTRTWNTNFMKRKKHVRP